MEVIPGEEPVQFWNALGGQPAHLGGAFVAVTRRAKLHAVRLGEGFLEMPQVVAAGARLDSSLLESTGVYILDDFADIWVWTGRRSSRLVRAAAQKMCVNLKNMLPRPEYAVSLRITEVLALCHPVLSSCLFFYFWHAWYCLILFPPTPFRFFLCLCLTSLFWLPYF